MKIIDKDKATNNVHYNSVIHWRYTSSNIGFIYIHR